jgi:hypothetical protein
MLSENSLFILSIRVIARSTLGPVTMHICVPCRLLFLRQGQATYCNINSVIPRPVAFFIQRFLYCWDSNFQLVNQVYFKISPKSSYSCIFECHIAAHKQVTYTLKKFCNININNNNNSSSLIQR